MKLSTTLELPFFDYTDQAMVGARLHETIKELRAHGWMALGPYGCIVLDRASVEFFLREVDVLTPGKPMAEMFALGDGALTEMIERNILNIEGSAHRRLRTLINPVLSARAIDCRRPEIAALFKALLESQDDTRALEFVTGIAMPYASQVLANLLGVPISWAPQLQSWSDLIERQFDVASLLLERQRIEQAVEEAYAFTDELISSRRRKPGTDVISALLDPKAGPARFTDQELRNLVLNLLAGGVDTVQGQLSQMVRLLAERPEQWQLLRARPELVPAAVQEAMRFEPVLPFTARVLLETVHYREVEFPAGSVMMLCLLSANHESVEDGEPLGETFDIAATRRARPITFGVGPHHCMGANLARAELEEALRVLLQEFEGLHLAGEPTYASITGIYGLRSLPLSFA